MTTEQLDKLRRFARSQSLSLTELEGKRAEVALLLDIREKLDSLLGIITIVALVYWLS